MAAKHGTIKTGSSLITSEALIRRNPRAKGTIKKVLDERRFTPDMPTLEKQRGHLLFTYGTLKTGHCRHQLLRQAGAEYIGQAVTTHYYSLYVISKYTDTFPIMLPCRASAPAGHIVGQLFLVYPKTIAALDKTEQNTIMFVRMKMTIQILTRPRLPQFQQYETLPAYAYLGLQTYWSPFINLGEISPIASRMVKHEDNDDTYFKYLNFDVHRYPSAP